MTFVEKVEFLAQVLNQPEENYADSFKQDILMYFNDEFSDENTQLSFLDRLNSKEEIIAWIEKLTSRLVMKFDPAFETEADVIFDYIENG